MKSMQQYTIRNIPPQLDQFLRQYARGQGKSLNETIVTLLKERANFEGSKPHYNDLNFLFGSWKADAKFNQAMKDFEQIDPDLWK
jgi:hypothetical protein